MSHRLGPLLWTITAVLLSAATAFFVARTSLPGHSHDHRTENTGGTFHDWLHSQLEITPEQEERLAPIETVYADQRKAILQRIQQAGENLAAALESEPAGGPVIDDALTAIHDAQGELQRVTIEHFLMMKEHLSPEQSQRLLQWTRESITHHDEH